MTLHDVMALYLRYFTEFVSFRGALHKSVGLYVYDVVVKSSRSLPHLLMSFLLSFCFEWTESLIAQESCFSFTTHVAPNG